MKTNLLIAIYSQPENYPPTLNALGQLTSMFQKISLLFRPLSPLSWKYAEHISFYPSGAAMSAKEQEQLPVLKKMILFIGFVVRLVGLCKRERPGVVLLYDPMALAAFSFAKKFIGHKPIIWYHNHDVMESGSLPRFSLQGIAVGQERKMFTHIDVFTLPSEERKAYFPMEDLKGRYMFLPNLPAVSFYRQFSDILKPPGVLRLIFQGQIAEGHGIEEIISMMPFTVKGRPVQLVLVGWLREDFKQVLDKMISEKGLEKEVELMGYVPYRELPKLTATCHVGIAIYTKTDVMNKTMGTASNKIYEYAALGLPILYFDNEHFRQHLGRFSWAVPTLLNENALVGNLESIATDYENKSAAAQRDFQGKLNYEHFFKPVADYLEQAAGIKNQ